MLDISIPMLALLILGSFISYLHFRYSFSDYSSLQSRSDYLARYRIKIELIKVLMQGKLFQGCTHFFYCSVLSLGGKVNTRLMSQPDKGSIFTKIIYEIFWSWETIMWIFKIIKLNTFNLLGYHTITDASIFVYKFRP